MSESLYKPASLDTDLVKILERVIPGANLDLKALSPAVRQLLEEFKSEYTTLDPIEDDFTNCFKIIETQDLLSYYPSIKSHELYYYSDKLDQRVLISLILKLLELENSGLSEERLGKALDACLLLIRLVARKLELNPRQIIKTGLVLKEMLAKDLPGLPEATRTTLINQLLQITSARSVGLPSIFKSRDDKSAKYPYEVTQVENLINSLSDETSPEKIASTLIAVSSPFACNLGLSNFGQENLVLLTQGIVAALGKIDLLPKDSAIRLLVEEVLVYQLFHCLGENFPKEVFELVSEPTKEKLSEYLSYRQTHPLWADKTLVFKTFYQDEAMRKYEVVQKKVLLEIEEKTFEEQAIDQETGFEHPKRPRVSEFDDKIAICCNTSSTGLLGFLNSGVYLTLYEVFRGLGGNDMEARSRCEDRIFLLSTGTPDDPYPRYGSMNFLSETNLHTPSRYGNYALVLKPEVLKRASLTSDDSFRSGNLPYPADNSELVKSMTLKNTISSSFTEAQIFGGITLEGVDFVLFKFNRDEAGDDTNQHLIRELIRRGIPFKFKDDLPESYPVKFLSIPN